MDFLRPKPLKTMILSGVMLQGSFMVCSRTGHFPSDTSSRHGLSIEWTGDRTALELLSERT